MKSNIRNIVLLGHMGSGKSTIGKALAQKLSYEFIDTDQEIEKYFGTKINNIFQEIGEQEFRKIEEKSISEILNTSDNKVIALGGGTFENKNIRSLVLKKNLSVWLKCNISILVERLKKTKHRPLLIGKNIKSEIMKLDKIRKINYERSDYHCDVSIKKKKEILKSIIKFIRSIR